MRAFVDAPPEAGNALQEACVCVCGRESVLGESVVGLVGRPLGNNFFSFFFCLLCVFFLMLFS